MTSTSGRTLTRDTPRAKMYIQALTVFFALSYFGCDKPAISDVLELYGLGRFTDTLCAQWVQAPVTAQLSRGKAPFNISGALHPDRRGLALNPDHLGLHYHRVHRLPDPTNENRIVRTGDGRRMSVRFSNGDVLCRICDGEDQTVSTETQGLVCFYFVSRVMNSKHRDTHS